MQAGRQAGRWARGQAASRRTARCAESPCVVGLALLLVGVFYAGRLSYRATGEKVGEVENEKKKKGKTEDVAQTRI